MRKVDEYPFRGLSIHLDIGAHAGWGIKRDGPAPRIFLGRVGLTAALRDLDALHAANVELDKAQAEVAFSLPLNIVATQPARNVGKVKPQFYFFDDDPEEHQE